MSLAKYFEKLIASVEDSETITNQGTDSNGFFKPTRTIVLRQLQLLKDLHAKPLAKPMLREAWRVVVESLPPELLVMTEDERLALKKMLE